MAKDDFVGKAALEAAAAAGKAAAQHRLRRPDRRRARQGAGLRRRCRLRRLRDQRGVLGRPSVAASPTRGCRRRPTSGDVVAVDYRGSRYPRHGARRAGGRPRDGADQEVSAVSLRRHRHRPRRHGQRRRLSPRRPRSAGARAGEVHPGPRQGLQPRRLADHPAVLLRGPGVRAAAAARLRTVGASSPPTPSARSTGSPAGCSSGRRTA